MEGVICGVAVIVVSCRSTADAGNAVDGVGIYGLKAVGSTRFADVSKGIVRERLRSDGAAICAGDLHPIFRAQRDMIFGLGSRAGGCVEVKTWRRGSIAKW